MVDFHTHHVYRAGAGTGKYLLSAADGAVEGVLTSLEFHPWNSSAVTVIPEDFASRLRPCAALGEIGLDRLRGAEWPVQLRIFDALLTIGAAEMKPVVIHSVRAAAEVIRMTADYPAPRLIHGFRGGVRRLEEYLAAGFYVSLGVPALSSPEIGDFLRRNGLERIGFESDEVPEDEYLAAFDRAARVWDIAGMEQAAESNFREFLGFND